MCREFQKLVKHMVKSISRAYPVGMFTLGHVSHVSYDVRNLEEVKLALKGMEDFPLATCFTESQVAR